MAKQDIILDFHEPKIASRPEAATLPLILLAEDSADDALLMRLAFQKTDLSNPLAIVRDGQDAIDYLRGDGPYADRQMHPFPGLLLLDLKMPRMNGFDVLAWLRRHPELDGLSVVVVSTSALESDIQKAMDLGAHEYRVKPTGFDALVAMLQELHARWLSEGANRVCQKVPVA